MTDHPDITATEAGLGEFAEVLDLREHDAIGDGQR